MKIFVLIFIGIICLVQVQCNATGFINLTISNFDKNIVNGQAVSKQINLESNSVWTIQVDNIPDEVTFLVLQVHGHEKNLVLGYNETFDDKLNNEGSNLGLVLNPQEPRAFVYNKNNENISVLVAVVYYTSQGPIPGACKKDNNLQISPYLKVLLSDAKVEIDVQPASFEELKCENNNNKITYDAYRLFISENDFSADTYFSTINKMITVEDIIKNGVKIPAADMSSQMQRIYSAYPGTGSVYAMIANHKNYSSAYVTGFSYACSPFSDPSSCNLFNETFTKFVCIVIMIIGVCLTFIGHAGPNFEMFLWGSINGCLIGYILFVPIGWSMLIGIASGIISLILLGFEISFIPIFQAALTSSSLIFGLLYFFVSDGAAMFETNRELIMIYFVIIMVVLVIFCSFPSYSNILFSSFVGSYMSIIPIDYWLGSNLKFIMINVIRRLTVDDFNMARINHPFQAYDIILMILWAGLMLWGMKKQNENAEFVTTVKSSRGFPILSASRNKRRVLVLGETDRVSRNNGLFA